MLHALSRGAARRVQTTVRHAPPGGQTLVCEWYSTAVIDETGAPISILSLVLDVSQRAALEAQLRAQATHDTLTGLANRRLFDDRLGLAVAKARRSGHTVGLLFIDLDGFKDVNDRLGHDAGDRLLVETSRRFAACMREGDTLARLGGDEFVIILDPLDQPGNAALVARKLLDALAAPFELGRSSARVSASMGIALFPEDAADAAMLVKCADAAMYESKRAGKNRWVYFAPEHEASAALRP
jgi:diguanylate cyclase (GGDEF)-like protein